MFQVLENQNDQELIFYKSIFVIFIAIHNMFGFTIAFNGARHYFFILKIHSVL